MDNNIARFAAAGACLFNGLDLLVDGLRRFEPPSGIEGFWGLMLLIGVPVWFWWAWYFASRRMQIDG
jgi:hypothetical protein